MPPKREPKRAAKKATKADRKAMAVQIRGSDEWKAWLESLADREGDTVAKFMERLARKYAEDKGLPPPPRR